MMPWCCHSDAITWHVQLKTHRLWGQFSSRVSSPCKALSPCERVLATPPPPPPPHFKSLPIPLSLVRALTMNSWLIPYQFNGHEPLYTRVLKLIWSAKDWGHELSTTLCVCVWGGGGGGGGEDHLQQFNFRLMWREAVKIRSLFHLLP